MSERPGRVALPLLLPRVTSEALPRATSSALPRIAPAQRAQAVRAWLSVIGLPGDEAPARFACALASALPALERHALLSARAPEALVAALQQSGAAVLRVGSAPDADALQGALGQLGQHALVLVVEPELAAQLRGVLDVWVGPLPAHGADPQLGELQRAADLIVSAPAGALAAVLARELAPRLAARAESPRLPR